MTYVLIHDNNSTIIIFQLNKSFSVKIHMENRINIDL